MKTIYLCGGINGLSDADAKGWREEAAAAFAQAGWFVLDPMDRDYRGKEDGNASEIVNGDISDIRRSDVLFVNASRPSWGTAMEIVYAARVYAKSIVVAFGTDKPSPWLVHHCEAVLPTMREAISFVGGPIKWFPR